MAANPARQRSLGALGLLVDGTTRAQGRRVTAAQTAAPSFARFEREARHDR